MRCVMTVHVAVPCSLVSPSLGLEVGACEGFGEGEMFPLGQIVWGQRNVREREIDRKVRQKQREIGEEKSKQVRNEAERGIDRERQTDKQEKRDREMQRDR